MRETRRRISLMASLALGFVLAAPSRAGERLIILQPGYPGSTGDAREFVARLSREIAGRSGIDLESGEYHNEEAKGLEALRRDSPSVGILSLGMYLEHREEHELTPLLWSRPPMPYHLVVRKGTFARPSGLEGKTVTGTPLLEREFVTRVLLGPTFQKKTGVQVEKDWRLEPARYFSRGVRNLRKERCDAVLLNDLEYRGLRRLSYAEELEVIHSTEAVPSSVVVVIGGRLDSGQRERLAEGLKSFPASAEGKSLLETMGIEGFVDIERERLGELQRRFSAGH